MLESKNLRNKIGINRKLKFGNANLVVAVPDAWIDVQTVADLEEISFDLRSKKNTRLRVATKYPNLTSEHFKKRGVHADCIKLNGAMELAPSMGLCRRIVDLSESGETLKANGLIEIEEIMKVSTRLAVNRNAYKTNFKEINKIIKKFERFLHDE